MKTRSDQGPTAKPSIHREAGDGWQREASIRSQRRWSSLLLAAAIAVAAGYGILALYVPRLAAAWNEAGVDLTVTQQWLVRCSGLARESGAVVALLVFLGLLGALVRRTVHVARWAVPHKRRFSSRPTTRSSRPSSKGASRSADRESLWAGKPMRRVLGLRRRMSPAPFR